MRDVIIIREGTICGDSGGCGEGVPAASLASNTPQSATKPPQQPSIFSNGDALKTLHR